MREYDLIVIGGGSAGMSAAIAAKKEGITSILILERENLLGGQLNQYVHNGFGEEAFGEEVTGPEYVEKITKDVKSLDIDYKLNTMVLELAEGKIVTAVNKKDGIIKMKAKAIILTTGAREKPKNPLGIPGTQYAGIFTVGTAQRFINTEGYLPGKEVVILGSDDIGLVMASTLIIEGAKVKAVLETMPYLEGSERNRKECLEDFSVPLLMSKTVVDVRGKDRLQGIVMASVDENRKYVKDTEEFLSCDTLLLSVGLSPESELARKAGIKISKSTGGPRIDESFQTSLDGVFACGNLVYIHDMYEDVSEDASRTGQNAAKYIKGQRFEGTKVELAAGEGIKYVVPRWINPDNINDLVRIKFRVNEVYGKAGIFVYFGEHKEFLGERTDLNPGDIESITIEKEMLNKYPGVRKIDFKIEKH